MGSLSISGLKYQVMKLSFWLKNDGEKWSIIFHFEIHHAPSEIPANNQIRVVVFIVPQLTQASFFHNVQILQNCNEPK